MTLTISLSNRNNIQEACQVTVISDFLAQIGTMFLSFYLCSLLYKIVGSGTLNHIYKNRLTGMLGVKGP